MNTSSRLPVQMASSCIAYFTHHSIPFNCSETALRVTEAMIGSKVDLFCVAPCLLCFPNLAPELVPRIFDLISPRKPGWNFSYEPKAKFIPVNQAHVKRPLETLRSDDAMATRTKKLVLEGKTTTYICPILRFMKDVNRRRRNFLSLPELG